MKLIDARDYGIYPNTGQDMTKAFQTMISQFKKDTTFSLATGVYHFSATEAIVANYYLSNTDVEDQRSLSIQFKDMKNIILEGNQSRFIYSGQTIPLTIDNCEGIQIKNITIDWQIPLSAEGQIIEACTDWVDIAIDPKRYPHHVKEGKLWFSGEDWEMPYYAFCEFDGVTKKVAYRTGDTFKTIGQKQVNEGVVRFFGDFKKYQPKVGNYGVVRHNRRLHPGIFLNESKAITIDAITIHNTGGLGILAQFCKDLTFKAVRFEPNTALGRKTVSGHDDGLHLSNNSGEIVVEQCWFYGLMDDPINVHGTSVRVIEKLDKYTIKGLFVHEQAIGFTKWACAQQEIAFINHKNMSTYGKSLCKNFELLSPKEFIISFEEELPKAIQIGDALENLSNTPSVICKNNYFGSCRARGMLISTPKPVLIADNVFESAGSAILIPGDANYWYESGACQDVTIKGNHFSDCCMTSIYQFCEGVISICPEIPLPDRESPFHRQIRIIENTFQVFDYSVLYALSVQGLEFSHNRIIRSNVYESFFRRKHMINLEYCKKVKIEDNIIVGDVLGQDIGIGEMEVEDVQLVPINSLPIIKEEVN